MKKVNLTSIYPTKVFKNYIYPVLAKEFLIICNDYQDFFKEVDKLFILTKEQYDSIADEWILKEVILSEVEEPEQSTEEEIADYSGYRISELIKLRYATTDINVTEQITNELIKRKQTIN